MRKGFIELHSLIKYKKTLSDFGNNHYILEEKLLYNLKPNFSFGIGIDYLDTDKGYDVLDDGFLGEFTDSGHLPVWDRKEQWLGASLIGVYNYKGIYHFDGFIHKKIQGRNTDIATTIGVGWGRVF